MSTFQKRHYEAIAKILGGGFYLLPDDIVDVFCEEFLKDNSSFNERRFRKAIDKYRE